MSAPDVLDKLAPVTEDLDIGLLVSNAGSDAMGAILRVDLDRLVESLNTNAVAHLKLAHHFGRRFEQRGGGGLLLVGSLAGLQGTPYTANYAGAKAYVLNMGMGLNYELKAKGVHVTVLVPGPTKTPGLLQKPAIPIHTLPAPKMNPAHVAKVGLRALEANKPYVIAGRLNRMLARMGGMMGRVGARNMWGGLMRGIVPANLK